MEELEEHLLSLGEQRASAQQQRAAADETFRMEPASAAVSAALGVLSRSGALPGWHWDKSSSTILACALKGLAKSSGTKQIGKKMADLVLRGSESSC